MTRTGKVLWRVWIGLKAPNPIWQESGSLQRMWDHSTNRYIFYNSKNKDSSVACRTQFYRELCKIAFKLPRMADFKRKKGFATLSLGPNYCFMASAQPSRDAVPLRLRSIEQCIYRCKSMFLRSGEFTFTRIPIWLPDREIPKLFEILKDPDLTKRSGSTMAGIRIFNRDLRP
jgi:hypothetical protein